MLSATELVSLLTWAAGAFFTACVTLVGITMWINKALSLMKDSFLRKIENLEHNIITKLEYHERHDDERFQEIQRDIWDIRIRNAAQDGLTLSPRTKHGSSKPIVRS